MSRIAAVAVVTLLPGLAFAQNGAIAGVVKDASGGVLPGVTVEAASPALIEKVRTAVSDVAGQYQIIDLRPGTYTVTFTLGGFNTVRREGIQLTGGFTASVDVELKIGAVEETITVSGASPIIDTQTIATRTIVGRDTVDTLPTNKQWQAIGKTLVGIQKVELGGDADVGGTAGEASPDIRTHGGDLAIIQIDGLNNQNTSANTGLMLNEAQIEDIIYETSAISVEVGSGGIRANVIPKEGGNRFSGSAFDNWASSGMQGHNLSQALIAKGAPSTSHVQKMWDQSITLGGPIRADRLWFFFSERYWGRNRYLGDIYFAKDPNAFVYDPDLSRPGIQRSFDLDVNLRLTWQATPKNKIRVFGDEHPRCHCTLLLASNIAADAGQARGEPRDYQTQVSWTSMITNKLLFEAGSQLHAETPTLIPSQGFNNLGAYPVVELSTGRGLVAPAVPLWSDPNYVWQSRAVMNYVTGSHALKVGGTFLHANNRPTYYSPSNDTSLQVLNGVPAAIVEYTTPYTENMTMNAGVGLFAQDKWTIKRLTVDLGSRFDYLNWQVDAESAPGGTWVGPRSFSPVYNVPDWRDLSPRMGVAYDLLGNGRTALKASVSRYVSNDYPPITIASNPLVTSVNSATRVWTDPNSTNENQLGPLSSFVLGPLSNSNFGKNVVTTRYDSSVSQGWFKRPYNWEEAVTLQQQLGARTSATVGYYHRSYGNFTATNNLDVTPADYDPFCITAPTDSRLPGGGGFPVCGVYDITPAKFGHVNNLIVFNPKQRQIYDGVDFSLSARVSSLSLYGGLSVGRVLASNCAVFSSPVQQFCDHVGGTIATTSSAAPASAWLPIGTITGSSALPWWNISTAVTFQSNPGPNITAAYTVPNSVIAPSLGRNLAAGARATATVQLVAPGTMYGDRWNQIDLRVSKRFPFSGPRGLEVMADLYNVFNANPVVTQNNTFGPNWQRPQTILPARFLKIGARFKF